jgi:hypothetical protein
MRKELKIKRDLDKLLSILKQSGNTVEIDTSKIITEVISADPLPKYWEAEATLCMLQKPTGFITKKCKREVCENIFGTSYRAVAYCSDHCRIKELASYGINWDPSKTLVERWGGEFPLLVPHQALELIYKMVQDVLNIETHEVVQNDQEHIELQTPEKLELLPLKSMPEF